MAPSVSSASVKPWTFAAASIAASASALLRVWKFSIALETSLLRAVSSSSEREFKSTISFVLVICITEAEAIPEMPSQGELSVSVPNCHSVSHSVRRNILYCLHSVASPWCVSLRINVFPRFQHKAKESKCAP